MPCDIPEPYFTCCKGQGDAAISVRGLLGEGRCSCASVTPNHCWGELVSLQGGWWEELGLGLVDPCEATPAWKFLSESCCVGQCCGIGAVRSWQLPPLFPGSLAVAAGLSVSKRPFPWNYGRMKQRRVFSWAAVQRAGVSSRGLSYQIHQDISTSCILNSLIPKNKVIFSALEADICLQGLRVFLEQWAQIFFVERDILERVLNPSTSSCSGMEIAVQVWSKACWSLLIYLADV